MIPANNTYKIGCVLVGVGILVGTTSCTFDLALTSLPGRVSEEPHPSPTDPPPDPEPDLNPTFEVDFTSLALPPSVSFSRLSPGTYLDASGVMRTAGSGSPRFEYDPVSGELLGLLVERSRTNLALRSEEFSDSYWTKLNSTITVDSTLAPDSELTADKLEETAATDRHAVLHETLTLNDDSVYTVSFFVKAAERDWVFLATRDKANRYSETFFDLNAGVVGTASPHHIAKIKRYANGWYRCSVAFETDTGGAVPLIALGVSTGDGVATHTGIPGSGVYIWGAQLEEFATPTSYIPTVSTSVFRQADVISFSSAPWFSESTGTFLVEMAPTYTGFSTSSMVLGISDGSLDNGYFLYMKFSNNMSLGSAVGSSLVGEIIEVSPLVDFSPIKTAFRYGTDSMSLFYNGHLVSTLNGLTLPVGLNNISLGSYGGEPTSMIGYIKGLKFWPREVGDSELVDLTGP